MLKIGIAIFFLFLSALPFATAAGNCVVDAARDQIGVTLTYDSRYTRLIYPGGDIPMDRGVCTDVLIRAFRKCGEDLQIQVHEDMKKSWSVYPKIWGLSRPDSNIDHRRVPNLAKYFSRFGTVLSNSSTPDAYLAGDLVTWRLPSGVPHIGIVSDKRSENGTPLIIHNIGQGAREEDSLFEYTITGHYRYPQRVPREGGK